MKAKSAGILAAVLGSICCVGPLLLIAVGLGTGAAVIGRYHWFFVSGAIAVLAWGWIKHFREKARCACEHRAINRQRISLFTLLVASVIVLAFAGLNVRSCAFAGSPAATLIANANLQRVAMHTGDLGSFSAGLGVNGQRDRTVGADAPPRRVLSE